MAGGPKVQQHVTQRRSMSQHWMPQRSILWSNLGLSLVLGLGGILLSAVDLSSMPLGWAALAQSNPEFETEKLALFARIVLEVEPHRLAAQERSATADSSTRELIRRDFIRTATEIITAVGLSVPDYNRITLALRSENGQALREQIEAEIRQLQASGYEPGQL